MKFKYTIMSKYRSTMKDLLENHIKKRHQDVSSSKRM